MPKQKQILAACVAVSLSLHIGFLIFLHTHSLWFNSSSSVHSETVSFSLEKKKRDQILKESFTPNSTYASSSKHSPENETSSLSFPHSPVLQEPRPTPNLFTAPLSFEEMLSAHSFPVRTFSLPALQNLDLFADLPKDLIIPISEKQLLHQDFHPHIETASIASPKMPLAPPISQETHLSFSSEKPTLSSDEAVKISPTIPMPSLPEVPSLADLETINLSNAFDAELTFSPRTDGPGYLFALTLIPHPDLQIPNIRQHFIFLIDRSNSIQHDRLLATKNAVFKAIEELDEGDTFNIITFDSKIEKLSPSLLKANSNTLAKTNEFLNKIQLGSFFSPGDLYKSLFLTIPSGVQDDELYTAILLTDGEGLSKKGAQETLLRDWTLQNRGRVALYALSMETDLHLATLDAVCHFNKGRLIYTNSYRGLKRKLLKLTKNIKTPIAKNIALKAISKSPNAKIEIYPMPTPSIYLDQPYVLLGSTQSPEDFILFVQGRLKNQWLNIKKTISFVHAKKGGNSLKSEWALQKAYQHYEKYVLEGNQKYLTEARALLEPFNLQIAFQ